MLTSNLTAEHSLSVFMSFKCCWLGSICDRRSNLKSNSLKAEDYRPTWTRRLRAGLFVFFVDESSPRVLCHWRQWTRVLLLEPLLHRGGTTL